METEETKKEGEEIVEENMSSPLIEAAQKANAEKKELLDREEALQSRKEKFESDRLLGGNTEAGVQTPPVKKLTDVEYAEALERGEVNPMKEDGFN